MTRRRVDMRLPDGLLARVDAKADELGQSRTKFVERALEVALSESRRAEPAADVPAGQTTVDQQIAGDLGAERLARFAPKS